jgi:uncharacterized DUF497 family protein
MRITYAPNKRAKTLAERNLDFEDAVEVFAGVTFELLDTRRSYGEERVLCYGYLRGRLVMIGYTTRGDARHVFSMRKTNEREKRRFAAYVGI